jgi:site-specific recombinase XerD
MERVQRSESPPLTGLAPRLIEPIAALFVSMRARGYAASTLAVYARVIAHFVRWARTARQSVATWSEATAHAFVESHLPTCRCAGRVRRTRHGVPTVLRHLLATLREQGVVRPPVARCPTAIEAEVERFDVYLRAVCGAAAATRRYRKRYVCEFLTRVFGQRPIVIERLSPSTVVRFVTDRARGCAPGTARVIASTLRSYLRFQQLGGTPHAAQLLAAVPHVAGWRLATLPRTFTDAQLRSVLAAFDRVTPVGRRDYAMVLCMATLGLRASEVATLLVCNIDWRAGTLCIADDKSRRSRLLPLPAEVGHALADYLGRGRPATTAPQLFVRHAPPRGAALGASIVRNAARAAYARAGLPSQYTGTHLLRHTVATRLVCAGTPLKEIADVLGHQSIDTTAIYAKVDLPRLRAVALPWPRSLRP